MKKSRKIDFFSVDILNILVIYSVIYFYMKIIFFKGTGKFLDINENLSL